MITLFKTKHLGACLPFLIGMLFVTPSLAGKSSSQPFGPTGFFGDPHPGWPRKADAIHVKEIEKGSPADGKLQLDDLIVGIGNRKFEQSPWAGLAAAIDVAETKAAGGKLTLLLETGKQVAITLPVLGSYSRTAPYKCPKTEKIIAQTAEEILSSGKIGLSPTRTDLLGLMATGEKRYLEVVGQMIHKGDILDIDPQSVEDLLNGVKDMGLVSWYWGYNLITLSEYYLLTKDEKVLPAIRTYALGLARGQDASGCWGHRMLTTTSGGRLPGYAQMNQPSISNFMGMLMARKCGIKDPVLDQAIERTNTYVADHVDKGGFPYGVGGPVARTFNNNGMSGAAAICMSLLNNQHGAKYFSQNAATTYGSLTSGHASAFFNPLWTPLGASLSGPEVTQQFFRNSLWYFNNQRHWNGGFPRTDNVGSFAGQALLMYCLPRRALLITGREADPSIWVKGRDATEVIMRSQLVDVDKSTDELLQLLDHPTPQVAANIASVLMERTGIYRRAKKTDDFTAKIMKVVRNGNTRQRVNALACFGERCNRDFSAPHLKQIGAILRDKKEPFVVRLAAAKSLGSGTFMENARPYYNDVLELMFAERSADNDPFRLIDREIGEALNGICDEPFAANLVTDKDLFYKVSLRLLDHKRQKARFTGIKMLRGMPLEDFSFVSDKLMHAIENKDPTYQSYHNVQDTVAPGVEILANLNIKEGMDILLDTVMSPGGKWGFKQKMLYHALPLYGGNAKPYIPKFEEHPNIAKNKDKASWKELVDAINADKEPAQLISLAEAIRAGKSK